MIQRIQSLFFLFSSLLSLSIVFYFPILSNEETFLYLYDGFIYLRLLIFLSIFLSLSLIFVGIDAFFNFPRVRPYSLINLFWVIAFIYTLKAYKTNE